MSIRDFYNDIKSKSKAVKNNELSQLYKKPVHESREETPITQVFKPNIYYQADLLYMPEDKGYKYILVVVDVYDGKLDAEPLKVRDALTVMKAFKEIFERGILSIPFVLTVDSGTEFKGVCDNYLKSLDINIKTALTGRHRQVATVERANQKIGTILFKRMVSQELLTGEQNNDWVDDLKPLIEVLNEHRKKPYTTEISEDPIANSYTGNLYKIGQRVRIQLDYPVNTVNEGRLIGKFRSTDIRWSPQIHRIEQVLLKPGFPPMYLVDGDDVARTKQQLSPVKGNEKPPDPKYIRGNPDHYIIGGIVDKRRRNNKDEYLISWKGFTNPNDNTWILGDQLNRTADLRAMKRDFNREH